MNKKLKILSLLVVLLLIIACGGYIGIKSLSFQSTNSLKYETIIVQSDHVLFSSAEELENNSDIILLGSPTKNFEEEEPILNYNTEKGVPGGKVVSSFYTPREIKIDKVLKGSVSDEIMRICEVAAFVKSEDGKTKKLYNFEENSISKKGSKYIYFLKKGSYDLYYINSINQGKFNIDGSDEDEKAKVEDKTYQYKYLKIEVLSKYANEIDSFVKWGEGNN